MAKVLNLEEPQVIESGKHYVYCLLSHFVYVFLNTNKRMQQHLLRNHQTRAKQAVDVYWLSIYIYTYKQSSINSPICPPSNNKVDSKIIYKLLRTIKFYTQSFMFFLRASSKRLQQNFFPRLCFHLHWKNLSEPSLTKNTLICYNIIL